MFNYFILITVPICDVLASRLMSPRGRMRTTWPRQSPWQRSRRSTPRQYLHTTHTYLHNTTALSSFLFIHSIL